MNKPYALSVWWIKRDFRLSDNAALAAALGSSNHVLPMYIYEPSVTEAPDYSDFHKNAISTALYELQERIRNLGAAVWYQEAEFEEAVLEICEIWKVDAIFSHEETGVSFTFNRDKRIKKWLRARGIHWHELPTNGVIRGLTRRSLRSQLWYGRMNAPVQPEPKYISVPDIVKNKCCQFDVVTAKIKATSLEPVSELTAQERLNSFLTDRSINYSGGISSPNKAFTAGSRLSAQLAWGTISLRTVFKAARERTEELHMYPCKDTKQWQKSLNAFTSRLHWHDHFIQRLESEPGMELQALNIAFRDIPYVLNEDRLQRWLQGQTGVPMIDACMRCLNTVGFLNFRMRAMIVSYACHVLHLSWQDIMHPLARLFLDYEPGIHVSQLQMQAGVVGINTLRVYNPDKQMLDQDPKLQFVRAWVPELRHLSNPEIFGYLKSRPKNYPPPMSNFKTASAEMKKTIYSLKNSMKGKAANEAVLAKHGSRKPANKSIHKKPKKVSTQLKLF